MAGLHGTGVPLGLISMISIVVQGGGKSRCIDGLVVPLLEGSLLLIGEVLLVSLDVVHVLHWIHLLKLTC